MDKLKNKNTIVLIISAVLILIAIIVAVVATASSGKNKKETKASSEKHYLTGKEIRQIAKANAKIMKELEKKKYTAIAGAATVATVAAGVAKALIKKK